MSTEIISITMHAYKITSIVDGDERGHIGKYIQSEHRCLYELSFCVNIRKDEPTYPAS